MTEVIRKDVERRWKMIQSEAENSATSAGKKRDVIFRLIFERNFS